MNAKKKRIGERERKKAALRLFPPGSHIVSTSSVGVS